MRQEGARLQKDLGYALMNIQINDTIPLSKFAENKKIAVTRGVGNNYAYELVQLCICQ